MKIELEIGLAKNIHFKNINYIMKLFVKSSLIPHSIPSLVPISSPIFAYP
jgi:hypothetical protein